MPYKPKGIRFQKKYCDFRCWKAYNPVCSCWCGGMNHGINKVPVGTDPKMGYTEAEYMALISRDHEPTTEELKNVAKVTLPTRLGVVKTKQYRVQLPPPYNQGK